MTSPAQIGTISPLQDPTTASPWVPLWRIIEQIASAIGDSREADHYAKTRLHIRQVAAEGRLRIRGRHEINIVGQEQTIFSDIYTEIHPSYWKNSVINVLATSDSSETNRHTSPEKTPYAWGPKGLYEPNCYTGLQLNSDGVSQLIGDVGGTGLLADAPSISTETEPIKFSDIVSLKPTFWGMSIDLLKAWHWLRERRPPLGERQQAKSAFPKTDSILDRLWRDPVWSKVIATGITAGIGALAVWYFHTQNPLPPPPLVTTPAPAIPAAPPVVTRTRQPPQSSPIAPTPRQNRVLWDRGPHVTPAPGQGKLTGEINIRNTQASSIPNSIVSIIENIPQSMRRNPNGTGRIFVRSTPNDILSQFEGRTDQQAQNIVAKFIDNWLALKVRVTDILEYQNIHGDRGVLLNLGDAFSKDLIAATFSLKWKRQLLLLNKGDMVSIMRLIYDVDRIAIYMDKYQIVE
jgi:hypothetical protein